MAALTVEANAQNLLTNGRFDSDLAQWEIGDPPVSGISGSVFASLLDADSSDASASAALVNTSASSFRSITLQQCVDGVTPGTEYYLRGEARLSLSETATGIAGLYVTFHPELGCGGDIIDNTTYGSGPTTADDDRGVWHPAGRGTITEGRVAPEGAQSALVHALVKKLEPGGVLSARFDNVYFGKVGFPLCDGLAPTIGGGAGNDVIEGSAGPDVIVGLEGDDRIRGLAGDDRICGGPGNDVLKGGSGDDVLHGGFGDDVLRGLAGDDTLLGGFGADRLYGGGGADDLSGGLLADTCAGGAGADDVADSSCEVASTVP